MVKILVVEDDEKILSSIKDMLELVDHHVLDASDGNEGLLLARKEIPNLIISDIMMPVMDGYEFFEAIKQDLTTAHIPFIFLTALADYEDIRTGMNLGADDYLTKPFDFQQLTTAINSRLNKHISEEQMRLRRFGQRLVDLQERERRTLAYGVETDIQEPLNGLKMMLGIAINNQDHQALKTAYALTENLIDQSQTFVTHLMPTMINQLNIIAVLTWLLEQYKERHNLTIDFQRAGYIPELDVKEKILLYRIFDEILKNIVDHSESTSIIIRMVTKDHRFYTDIRDNGKGFDVQQALAGNTVGLRSMFEQVTLLNGKLNIHSVIGDGTQVTLDLDVNISDEPATESTLTQQPTTPVHAHQPHDTIKILIADDYDLIRRGLEQIISQADNMEVVAQASNRTEVLQNIRSQEIDVIILDMMMDDSSGFELTKIIRQQAPEIKILALSNYTQEIYVVEAINSGANGYLLKETPSLEIIDSIRKVTQGEQYIVEDLADNVMAWMLNADISRSPIANMMSLLTAREREILLLVVEGLTSSEIGEKLTISPRTVEKHRSNFMNKLSLKTPTQLIKFATENDLIGSP